MNSILDICTVAFCFTITERAAPYKKLRGGVVFVDAIPKSPSGKILRKVMKDAVRKDANKSKL